MPPADKTVQAYLSKVLHFLSFRARSRAEILAYLANKDAPKAIKDQVIARVEDLGLIDDFDFARQLINSRISKGYGPKKIRFDLLNKSLDRETIQSSLAGMPESAWLTGAKSYLIKKYPHFCTDPKAAKHDIYRVLLAKGHNGQTIRRLIDDLFIPE